MIIIILASVTATTLQRRQAGTRHPVKVLLLKSSGAEEAIQGRFYLYMAMQGLLIDIVEVRQGNSNVA